VRLDYVVKAGGGKKILVVPAMSRTFSDQDLASAERPKAIYGSFDNEWVSINDAIGVKLDKIRLENNCLSSYLQPAKLYAFGYDLPQRRVIAQRLENRHLRYPLSAESVCAPPMTLATASYERSDSGKG
jgi:hypothetical protein